MKNFFPCHRPRHGPLTPDAACGSDFHKTDSASSVGDRINTPEKLEWRWPGRAGLGMMDNRRLAPCSRSALMSRSACGDGTLAPTRAGRRSGARSRDTCAARCCSIAPTSYDYSASIPKSESLERQTGCRHRRTDLPLHRIGDVARRIRNVGGQYRSQPVQLSRRRC